MQDHHFNSLPNNKILDLSKLKAFIDDKLNINKDMKTSWEPEFSPFLVMFSKACLQKVVQKPGCVEKD